MMSGSDWLAGLGGAVGGINDERIRVAKEAHEENMTRLRAEIEGMLLERRLTAQDQAREDAEQGKNARHANPSGNTLATQEGLNERAGMNDATRRRGQDLNFQASSMRDATTRRGQDLDHEQFGTMNDRLWNQALMGNERARERNWLTERGQDIGYETSLRRRGPARVGNGPAAAGQSWLTIDDMDDGITEPDPLLPAPPALDITLPAPLPPSVMQRPAHTPSARPVPPGARQAAASTLTSWVTKSGRRFTVGEPVKLRDGKTVTIKKINSDGTFEYDDPTSKR